MSTFQFQAPHASTSTAVTKGVDPELEPHLARDRAHNQLLNAEAEQHIEQHRRLLQTLNAEYERRKVGASRGSISF
jgi:hypothetical protein